ncbi:MAG: galactokinase [bacterium]|jgi:galactokinase|nr:galactokinase [bacterium]
MKELIKQLWNQTFPTKTHPRLFFSPGRVNLMGEHIDYNGGFVFPTALSIGTYGMIQLRDDSLIQMISGNFLHQGLYSFELSQLQYRKSDDWTNYVKGVIHTLIQKGHVIDRGFDLVLYGDLPNSSGLSSSASVEVLIAVMMNDLFGLGLTKPQIAVLGKEVENHYVGVNCGIMDQFVIACGKKDHALLLNTTTLEYEEVPLNLGEYQIVICNSLVKRGLVDSKYNERRRDCEMALTTLQAHLPIHALCDLDMVSFQQVKHLLHGNPLLRARHAISENDRTKQAAVLLRQGDFEGFGALITKTHESLRDDFEVSISQLDTLVNLALEHGSIGSRMTGAGFGGCTVNLVKKSDYPAFEKAIQDGYFNMYQQHCEIYVGTPSDGTSEVIS